MALCTRAPATEQKLEPMRMYFGNRHCRSITFVDDTAGSLSGEYFDLNVITEEYEEKKYLVYLDNGSATPPTPASDQTLLQVSYTDNDTAATIAAAFVSAMTTATLPVLTETTTGTVDVLNSFLGLITVEVNTNAPSLTFAVDFLGSGGYLGQIGEASLSPEVGLIDVLDDAQGTIVQAQILTGTTAEISFDIREMTRERWQSLIGDVAGGSVEIDGKTQIGFGTSKLFQNLLDYAGRLVGHPVRLPFSNRDEDICMKRTAPNMSEINFSGSNLQAAPFTFTGYRDTLSATETNIVSYGDHSVQ